MAEHPIQMTPTELEASVIVRPYEGHVPPTADRAGTDQDGTLRWWYSGGFNPCGLEPVAPCPYEVGDVLFHQEEWHSIYGPDHPIANDDPYMFYRANQDDPAAEVPGMDWYPTDTMPCWASRYRAAIEDVRLVRLQEAVTEENAEDFGVSIIDPENDESRCWVRGFHDTDTYEECSAVRAFADWWDARNPDHPWSSNPMVRVVSLRHEEEEK